MSGVELDVRTPGQIESQSSLTADLGEGRSLVVLSGIACPEYNAVDDETREATWKVRLHQPAEALESWTVHVGLASISNDDSSWVFATDRVDLVVENEEVTLLVHLVVRGDSSFLHRFSYQVVFTRRLVTTDISGSLTWPTAWFRPGSTDPAAVGGVFSVTANTLTPGPSASGALGGAPVLAPVASGGIESVAIADDVCRATYRIVGAPKGQQLLIVADQHGLGSAVLEPVVPGSAQFTLTTADPARAGVDFVATSGTGVA